MIRIYYVHCSRQMGSIGIPGSKMQQAPCPSQKKKRKKKSEFILQALLKDNKNVRKGPSETKEGNLLHVFALCSCSSSLNKALPLKKKKKKEHTDWESGHA